MSSNESSGRRNKRRRKRRGEQQDPPSHQTPSQASKAAVAGQAVEGEAPVCVDDIRNDVAEPENTEQDADVEADATLAVEFDHNTSSESAPSIESSKDQPGGSQLAELTCELVEKDELIAALTEQLEGAAERLDRLHRNGADRGPAGTTSNPGFVLPPASEANDQVGQLVEAWEELDALTWMQAFDRKLDELTSLVSHERVIDSTPPQSVDHPAADTWMGRLDDETEEAEEEQPSRLAGWEEMKAQLMRSGGDAAKAEATSATDEQLSLDGEISPEWDLEAPESVDLENADRDALIVAVQERDEFISHLIRRLHSVPTGRPERIDWESLNNAPEELRERLQELEARLEEVLRMEECDLSLERARLARERARLEQMRRDVDRQGKGATYSAKSNEPEVSQNERRWLRVFNFGRKADHESKDEQFDD